MVQACGELYHSVNSLLKINAKIYKLWRQTPTLKTCVVHCHGKFLEWGNLFLSCKLFILFNIILLLPGLEPVLTSVAMISNQWNMICLWKQCWRDLGITQRWGSSRGPISCKGDLQFLQNALTVLIFTWDWVTAESDTRYK